MPTAWRVRVFIRRDDAERFIEEVRIEEQCGAYDETVPEPISSPVVQLLEWIAYDERTYGETMAAWTTYCPRLAVWEDALTAGLVEVTRDGQRGSKVVLTPTGSAALSDPRAA